MMLAEMDRYLHCLQQMRRNNEGDDTKDSPGYALDLVRIPVSVLPGRKTQQGYGAEITVTATPYITSELLPTTFRNMITNDVVDLLAPSVTQWVNDPELRACFDDILRKQTLALDIKKAAAPAAPVEEKKAVLDRVGKLSSLNAQPRYQQYQDTLREQQIPDKGGTQGKQRTANSALEEEIAKSANSALEEARTILELDKKPWSKAPLRPTAGIHLSGSMQTRRAYMPIPPSQIVDVFGDESVARIVFEAYRSLSRNATGRDVIQLMDVRNFLNEEVHAAYLFLNRDCESVSGNQRGQTCPNGPTLWDKYCPGLGQVVRQRQMFSINNRRIDYVREIGVDSGLNNWIGDGSSPYPEEIATPAGVEPKKHRARLKPGQMPAADQTTAADTDSLLYPDPKNPNYPINSTLTAALGWGLLVEASLLDEQLNQDFREAMIAKGNNGSGVGDCPPGKYFVFYGPDPAAEARQAFMEYVRCRWPVRVFALDPVVEAQNVEDTYSRSRELQIALAVGFASGKVNAQNMLRAARKLEWDMADVALNMTAIGFSHGEDTFGWRFYPRFQTPPNKGNLSAFWETIAGGPTTNEDLRCRQARADDAGVRGDRGDAFVRALRDVRHADAILQDHQSRAHGSEHARYAGVEPIDQSDAEQRGPMLGVPPIATGTATWTACCAG